jgi:hypothetical protein
MSCTAKWDRAWPQQEEGKQNLAAVDEDARYTGKTKGTQLGWTKDGLDCMNALMIDVARDRQANWAHLDNIFKEEMIRRYTKEDTRNPGGRQHDEEVAPEN